MSLGSSLALRDVHDVVWYNQIIVYDMKIGKLYLCSNLLFLTIVPKLMGACVGLFTFHTYWFMEANLVVVNVWLLCYHYDSIYFCMYSGVGAYFSVFNIQLD